MHFKQLKCLLPALLLAGPARAELLVTPPVFEDFRGTTSVRLPSLPVQGGMNSSWRLDILVPAADLLDEPVTLRRIGLRLRNAPGTGLGPLRGSVTLSTTRATSLDRRFASNLGDRPVTFFVLGRPAALATSLAWPVVFFELQHGFRLDPTRNGNLLVSLEIQAEHTFELDAAPTLRPLLLSAPDLFAVTGELAFKTPVLLFDVVRARPVRVAQRHETAALGSRAKPATDPPTERVAQGTSPGDMRLAPELQSVLERVANLEARVKELDAENQRLRSLSLPPDRRRPEPTPRPPTIPPTTVSALPKLPAWFLEVTRRAHLAMPTGRVPPRVRPGPTEEPHVVHADREDNAESRISLRTTNP